MGTGFKKFAISHIKIEMKKKYTSRRLQEQQVYYFDVL
jgi:hypothetical protein